MRHQEWSRRELLKSVGTGTFGVGVSAAVYHRMNRYIVGVTSDDGAVAAATLSDDDHDRIDLSEHTSMELITGVFSSARSESLLSRSDVPFVQPDRRLTHLTGPDGDQQSGSGQTLPWGIDRVNADVAHANGATGDGVDVAVIDGGIDDSHPDLEGNLADPDVEANHESWVACSGEDCTYRWSDDGGHGTHVAGTIAAADGESGVVGVAPEATLHALKVCSEDGGCRTSAIVAAIRYAVDRGWDVLNLSLGAPQRSPALRAVGRYALRAGVLPVVSAGNRGSPDSVGYPAAYDEFLAVSATDIEDEIADFSSTGPEVDIAAPGANACSTVVDGYDTRSGTSMAAPHVTGAVAQLVADGHSPLEARDRLLATADDLGADETEQGAGLVDVAAALGYDAGDRGTGGSTRCPSL